MTPFGFIDSPGEAAIALGLLVLFAVLGLAYVLGWMD